MLDAVAVADGGGIVIKILYEFVHLRTMHAALVMVHGSQIKFSIWG